MGFGTIQKILPYVTVSIPQNIFNSIGNRLQNGEHTLLVRATQILEKSKGYLVDPAQTSNYYPGSQQKLYVRYRYNF
ncbi:MAG: hypothetical protein IPP48_02695 [Chitinophagaceae bacterium]|nr:hypothetical protein [Chitinophagaceae bacterium]